MLTTHPRDAQVFAAQHISRLQEEAAQDHLRRSTRARCAVAASLRRTADRLDPVQLVRRPAW